MKGSSVRRRSPHNGRIGGRCRTIQSGQAILWAAVMLPFFLSVVGLAIDAGIVFGARRELQNVADSSARAGAMQVDLRAYRDSSGQMVVLDRSAARQVAAQYAAEQGPGLVATITVEPQRVVVEVRRDVRTSFVRLVGLSSVRVSAVSPASVRFGIERANR